MSEELKPCQSNILLTDKELSDPEYMRAYVEDMQAFIDEIAIERKSYRDAVIEQCAQAVRETEIVEANDSSTAQLGDAQATLYSAEDNVRALKGKP